MNSRVEAWYDANVNFEDKRLDEGRLERAVTLHTILELVGKLAQTVDPRLAIIDIGCGTGRYAIELARLGHKVTITDMSSGLIERARENAEQAGVEFASSYHCDARRLRDFPALEQKRYDLALMLGPLYHLLDAKDRADILAQALDMVEPGGFVAGSFVTRNAHLRDVCMQDPARLLRESSFYQQYLKDGRYERGSGPSMYHTTTHEIHSLIEQAKQAAPPFKVVKTVACEGFLGFRKAANLAFLSDEEFKLWVDVILESAEDVSTLGASDHLLVVLQREE